MSYSSLSVLAVFKNEATNLGEWLCHYFQQGVDKIVLVDNGSTDNWRPIVDHLEPDQKKKVICLMDERKHSQTQIYNSIFKSGLIDTDWLLVCDIDEFVYARSGLTGLSHYLNQELDSHIGSIMLPWKNFGSSGFISQPTSLRRDFVWRARAPFPEPLEGYSRGKYICRVNFTASLSVHRPLLRKGTFVLSSGRDLSSVLHNIRKGFVPNTEEDLLSSKLHLNHYAAQSLEYFTEIKSKRGDVFFPHLDHKDISYFKKFDKNEVLDRELSKTVSPNLSLGSF